MEVETTATAGRPVAVLTWNGVSCGWVWFPMPSWPAVFVPHAHAVPSDFTAKLTGTDGAPVPAAATATTLLSEATAIGASDVVVLPLPKTPFVLSPQA